MKNVLIILIIIYNIVFVWNIVKKKDYFGLGTIINLAINLNVLLYLAKWSGYLTSEPSVSTLILLCSIIFIFIIIMILSKSPIDKLKKTNIKIILKRKSINIFDKHINIYYMINIIYILLFLIENYIGSGNIAPYLFKIDIHTYSAPIISFVTRALFIMLVLNYLCFTNFKKKIYLIFFGIDILLFIVLRGARINVFMASLQLILFLFMYNYNYIIKNKLNIVKIFIALGIVIVLGIGIGNKRLMNNYENHLLESKMTYADLIKYSGPKDKLGILPWYYGYFPMSFANLDLTIKNIDKNNIRTYGLYTLRPILVGIFELDNIVPNYKDIEYADSIACNYTTAAIVRTGFMEFYLDFGNFAFIGILIYALIGLYFYNKINKDSYYILYYSFYGICWFFMSFQNMMIDITTLYGLIYLYLIKRFLVEKVIEKEL